MVMISSWCRRAKRISSGTRAIVPSVFRISQITPDGIQARQARARSTAASVCPARTSTPPCARAKREDVARPQQILGRVSGSIAA